MALSNLGQLYYKAGKVDAGEVVLGQPRSRPNGKLVAARINVASMNLEQMRKITTPRTRSGRKLEEDARFNCPTRSVSSRRASRRTPCSASSTWKAGSSNKNRLDLAKTLMDEAAEAQLRSSRRCSTRTGCTGCTRAR
jgi:hypothetical protein